MSGKSRFTARVLVLLGVLLWAGLMAGCSKNEESPPANATTTTQTTGSAAPANSGANAGAANSNSGLAHKGNSAGYTK